jgi:hypothetical protein
MDDEGTVTGEIQNTNFMPDLTGAKGNTYIMIFLESIQNPEPVSIPKLYFYEFYEKINDTFKRKLFFTYIWLKYRYLFNVLEKCNAYVKRNE